MSRVCHFKKDKSFTYSSLLASPLLLLHPSSSSAQLPQPKVSCGSRSPLSFRIPILVYRRTTNPHKRHHDFSQRKGNMPKVSRWSNTQSTLAKLTVRMYGLKRVKASSITDVPIGTVIHCLPHPLMIPFKQTCTPSANT